MDKIESESREEEGGGAPPPPAAVSLWMVSAGFDYMARAAEEIRCFEISYNVRPRSPAVLAREFPPAAARISTRLSEPEARRTNVDATLVAGRPGTDQQLQQPQSARFTVETIEEARVVMEADDPEPRLEAGSSAFLNRTMEELKELTASVTEPQAANSSSGGTLDLEIDAYDLGDLGWADKPHPNY